MKTNHSTVILLICAIGATKAIQDCIQMQNNQTCEYCYGGKTNSQGTCTKFPNNNPCFSDNSEFKVCLWCNFAHGYANSYNNTCFKTSSRIPNCEQPYFKQKGAKLMCLSCKGGFPSKDFSRCIPTSSLHNAPANCRDGARGENGKLFCALCQDGYIANFFTDGLCHKTELEGCWQVNNIGRCVACKAFEGYYAVRTGPYGISQVCEKGA